MLFLENTGAGPGLWGKGKTVGIQGSTQEPGGKGVYGVVPTLTEGAYGVYGKAASVLSYGIYSEGKAHIEGNLTWRPVTSYISVAGITFSNGYSGGVAPLYLPNGARVVEVEFKWRDTDPNRNATFRLIRQNIGLPRSLPPELTLVEASTTGGDELNISETMLTLDHLVQNEVNAYYLEFSHTSTGIWIYYAIVKYTIDKPY